MDDILDPLKERLEAADRDGVVSVTARVLRRAIAEIERLRGLAGAVSDGNDFATIRHVIRRMTDKEAVEAVIGNPR